jgi:hypothetical protein
MSPVVAATKAPLIAAVGDFPLLEWGQCQFPEVGSHGAAYPVYAEFLGSFALIPSLIPQHRKDETFLKFPYRFRASHPGFIHLPDDPL